MHREPEVLEASPCGRMFRLPCKDYLKGTCTNSFREKWHPPECLFYKSENGCRYEKSALMRIVKLMNSRRKGPKRMMTIVQWLCWRREIGKKVNLWSNGCHDRPGQLGKKGDSKLERRFFSTSIIVSGRDGMARAMCPCISVEAGQKCVKIEEKDKTAFFLPSENRCLLASTFTPVEREFVVDSCASMHMISKKDLSEAEMDTLTKSFSPTTVITANGEVQKHEEATVYVKELDIFLTMKVFENTPAVLLLGKLCDENGYSYEWINSQKPDLLKNGIRIPCFTENFVPIVIPDLSACCSSSVLKGKYGDMCWPSQPKIQNQIKNEDHERVWRGRSSSWTQRLTRKFFSEVWIWVNTSWSKLRDLPENQNHKHPVQKTYWQSRTWCRKFWGLDHSRSQNSQWRLWISKQSSYAVLVQDFTTQWIQTYPCRTKTSQETQRSLQKFLEPERKPKVIYTDNSLEFRKACEDLSWNHCTSTPHRSETYGIAERTVRRVKEGTSAVLLQSGLNESWWADSMECYTYLRNIQDLLSDDKTPYERSFGEPFNGPIIPFGSLVELHPITAKDQSRIHQFGKKVLPGLFLGSALYAKGIWKGDVLIADLESWRRWTYRKSA